MKISLFSGRKERKRHALAQATFKKNINRTNELH